MPAADLCEPLLTQDEVESYRRDGFVVPDRGLPDGLLRPFIESVEEVIASNPGWENLLRTPHLPKRPGGEGIVGGEKIFPFALHPAILDVVEQLIGPNIVFWAAQLFAKPPLVGKATPWHQDISTPIIKPKEPGRPVTALSIWIAIDEVGPDNGCLRFIPAPTRTRLSHPVGPQRDDAILNFELESTSVDESAAVYASLKPGHFSLHDMYVIHGANRNTSGRRRAGLSFQYMSSEDHYDRDTRAITGGVSERAPAPFATRPIWLVRGANLNPLNDFEIGHEGLETLDELAESAREAST